MWHLQGAWRRYLKISGPTHWKSGKVVCSRKIWQPMVTELLRRLAVQKVILHADACGNTLDQ